MSTQFTSCRLTTRHIDLILEQRPAMFQCRIVAELVSQDRLAMFNDYQLNGREGEIRAGTEGKLFGIGERHPDFSQKAGLIRSPRVAHE